ncbi:MAG: diaminopimelate epimerase [Burkholderiaceae bacterium]|jgi:diaminopimelate epimerase|nr:diaminopimelate epimerase [Burkholderiaceae bacterium]
MRIRFTKMQGAGNDFVVLDETTGALPLTPAQYRWLADRHFGVGADQILGVRAALSPDVDFEYVIHNADGGQVQHCGNGARCFVRYVRERALTAKSRIRVKIQTGVIELIEQPDGQVTVDMGAPVFDLARVPFDPAGIAPHALHAPQAIAGWQLWPLPLSDGAAPEVAVLSMGNPHAVQVVADVDRAPVPQQGPLIECHRAFPERVNAGFMQIVGRGEIRLRVYERGVGETLACGTGACAAVAAGIRLGLLDKRVQVSTPGSARGGALTVEWAGGAQDAVRMTGPAQTVFHGEIDLPDLP